MRIYFFIVFSFVLALSGCRTTLSVKKATSQEWWGGMPTSGGGNNYKVTVVASPKSEAFTLVHAWIGNREKGRMFKDFDVFDLIKKAEFRERKIPAGTKEFAMVFKVRFPGEGGEEGDPPRNMSKESPPMQKAPDNLPSEYQKGGIVFFEYANGKTGWIAFPEIEVLEAQMMP